jgi:serine/threonine-protein kinase
MNARTQLIAGRYEIGDRLGFGGMSTVHLAFDRRLERQVAVKLLAEHLAEDQQFVSRFRREALAAARLVHPNIVQVFDFGLDEASGRHFIVMEYIRGHSGAELLREHGDRHGVVHRDVKPGNLLRSDDGVVKLADFGIAKAGDAVSRITQVGSVLGTAAYLAPEQAAGEEATPRSDIYSLGVVAYQFMSGRLPYDAQSLTELALKQQREQPPPLDRIAPSVPRGVAQAVARALEISADRRPQSAEEFREELRAGAAGQVWEGDDATAQTAFMPAEPTSATRAMPRGAAAPAPEPARPRRLQPTPGPPTPPPGHPVAMPSGRNRRRWGTTLLLLLVLLGALAAIYFAVGVEGGGVQLRDVEYETTGESVREMKELIDENTR